MTTLPGRGRRRAVRASALVALAVLTTAVLTTACMSDDGGSTGRSGATTSATSTGTPSGTPSTGSPSPTTSTPLGVTVTLAGGAERTWTADQLLTLPRTQVRSADGTPVAGVSLPTIAGLSGSSPSAADAPLTTYDVTGPTGTVLVTRAESDPRIGDHPALLTILQGRRVDLVIPQDRTPARTLLDVTAVTVSTVAPAAAAASPGPGSVVVRTASGSRTVSLTTLEQRGYTLRRPGSPTTQERGARLTEVLSAAGVSVTSNELITVSGPSGAAVLTGGELISNLQEVGFSLVQNGRGLSGPLFLVSGDVTAARTVTGATTVTVSG